MKVILLMAMTLDGKIAKNDHHFPDWTGSADKKLFVEITKKAGEIFLNEGGSVSIVGDGDQIVEAIRVHDVSVSKKEAWNRSVDLLQLVGVPEPKQRAAQYPHEYSGGMRQRVMIAMGLLCQPDLLIADEPSTALDVTVQAQITQLLLELREKTSMSIIVITHDLAVVAEICDRVIVMYGGRIVEEARVDRPNDEPKPIGHIVELVGLR